MCRSHCAQSDAGRGSDECVADDQARRSRQKPRGSTGASGVAIGRLLVPDIWSGLSGPKSWLFSLVLGLAGAVVGYLIFTDWLGLGDTDVFDWDGILGAIIGVIILLPFVGIVVRLTRTG